MSSFGNFGKNIYLLSSKAKRQYAADICTKNWNILDKSQSLIKTKLNQAPQGYILVTDKHTSKSDPKGDHWTIDAFGKDNYGLDQPIGCIHTYPDNTLQVFTAPRTTALQVYLNAKKLYEAEQAAKKAEADKAAKTEKKSNK